MSDFADLLPEYLGRQRWFAGGRPDDVTVLSDAYVGDRLRWLVVRAVTPGGGESDWSVPLVAADPAGVPEFVHGHENAVLGEADGQIWFDGLIDPAAGLELLAEVAPKEEASRVRPLGAEQSNTSVVIDDRLVLKVYRRLYGGQNPDVELPQALVQAGFACVAGPLAVWEVGGVQRAVVQPYLAGSTDAWALALTSLRDLFASAPADPADCGGDFAPESFRLGQVLGQLHTTLASAFGVGRASASAPAGDGLGRSLSEVAGDQSIRIHGDLHLGQLLRTDAGWYVIDFEGEPSLPLEVRRAPASPLRDVAGMTRSFDYARAVALQERVAEERDALVAPADAWEERNRSAFLDGYREATPGAAFVDAADAAFEAELAGHELAKARYELAYEQAHRPDWADIPAAAIARLEARA